MQEAYFDASPPPPRLVPFQGFWEANLGEKTKSVENSLTPIVLESREGESCEDHTLVQVVQRV